MRSFAIRLATGRIIACDENDQSFGRALKDAYGKGAAICLCTNEPNSASDRRKLKICRGDREGYVKYWLARYAETGNEHAHRCRYASLSASQTGASEYDAGVLREHDDDGTVALRFALPLSTRKRAVIQEPSAGGNAASEGREHLASVSPLGLLHLLWERAGLNIWEPYFGKGRFSRMVAARLAEVAERISLGRVNLASIFASILVPEREAARAELDAILTKARSDGRRVVLVGEMAYGDTGP